MQPKLVGEVVGILRRDVIQEVPRFPLKGVLERGYRHRAIQGLYVLGLSCMCFAPSLNSNQPRRSMYCCMICFSPKLPHIYTYIYICREREGYFGAFASDILWILRPLGWCPTPPPAIHPPSPQKDQVRLDLIKVIRRLFGPKLGWTVVAPSFRDLFGAHLHKPQLRVLLQKLWIPCTWILKPNTQRVQVPKIEEVSLSYHTSNGFAA